MAQQTAVEWFEKNISKFISYHYEKADAYNSDRYPWSKQDALKYYNETYNK